LLYWPNYMFVVILD